MKLFGKKTLAMILCIAMVLSVCSMSVFAGDTTYILVDESASLTAPAEAAGYTVTWSSSSDTTATVDGGRVTGVAAGDTTITAAWTIPADPAVEGSVDENKTQEYAVTVVAKTATAVALKTPGDANKSVPYGGTFSESVLSGIKFEVNYGEHIKKEVTAASWSAGDDVLDTSVIGDSVVYTPTLTDISLEVPTVTVTVDKAAIASGASTNVGTITVLVGTPESEVKELLPDYAPLSLNNGQTKNFSIGDYTNNSNVNGCYNDWTTGGSNAYNDDYVGTYTFTATAKSNTYYSLSNLTCTVKAVDSDFEVFSDYKGKSLSEIATSINDLVTGMFGEGVEYIEIDDMDLEGGDLYIADEDGYMTEVDYDSYELSEFADMVYYPNGNGEDSYVDYVAYTDDEDGEEYVEGTIVFESSTFLLLTAEIGNDEVLDINGEDLLDAVYDWDDDFEVKYIKFSSIPNSSSNGYLYYEYDEDDDSNTKVTTSKSYYVDPTGSQAELTDFTYVPTDSTEGVINIEFKAHKSTSSSVTGIIQINVIEVADIIIGANKGQTVEIDPDLFLEFIEDKDTSNKDLEIVSVAISGAPYQSKKGYLVTDGEELNKSGTKTFYADEDDVDVDKKKYDLFDLYFKGGSSDNTVNGSFKVTYLREGSTTKRTAEGTIDFITGAATVNSLSGSTPAAMVVNFSKSLSAFEALGDNDNEYIVFTSLPVGGKLVYNWGQAGQKDVTVGTEYWLSYKAGKQLMANVTFVPSYSASKIDQIVSMNVRGYDDKGKSVVGQVNITVDYAVVSAQFTDVANSTYADSVDFLYNEGITTGMTATAFGPNSNVTRAQFVTFLWRAAGSPTVTGVTNTFTDVKNSGEFQYAYQAILWAVKNNITTGRSATKFDPAANVTHQELLTFLYRYDVNYLGHSAATSSYVSYTDFNSVDAYAQTPVKWADYKGILTGYAIQPKVAGTRATVALWLHRMLTL